VLFRSVIVSDTTEFGYAYLHDLCEAIAAFTQGKVAADRSAFHYQGADLRFAVERHLYFSCIECEPLFHAYKKAKSGKPLPIVYLQSNEQVGVARLLHPQINATRIKGRFDLRYVARMIGLRSARNMLRRWLQSGRTWISLPQPTSGEFPKILFHVGDVKFARYFESIANALPMSYSYLLALNGNMRKQMAGFGYPCLDLLSKRFQPKAKRSNRTANNSLEGLPWLTEHFDQIYAALALARPRCVIVAEGNAPSDAITSEACRLLSIPIICIQQGWAPFVHNGFRNMCFTKMLVWGKGFADLLQPYNPCQEFVAVGNHVLQHLAESMHELPREARTGVSFFLQTPGLLLSKTKFLGFLNLIEWTAVTFPNTPVLVRAHPNYPLPIEFEERFAKCRNIRLMPPKTHQLEDVMAASSVAVAVFSSTILEAICVGVLPIVCNLDSLPRYSPDVEKAGAGIEVHTINEAKQAISRAVEDSPSFREAGRGMAEFRTKLFEPGNAIKRITDEIVAACEQN
jgi:hypothetical protein